MEEMISLMGRWGSAIVMMARMLFSMRVSLSTPDKACNFDSAGMKKW